MSQAILCLYMFTLISFCIKLYFLLDNFTNLPPIPHRPKHTAMYYRNVKKMVYTNELNMVLGKRNVKNLGNSFTLRKNNIPTHLQSC